MPRERKRCSEGLSQICSLLRRLFVGSRNIHLLQENTLLRKWHASGEMVAEAGSEWWAPSLPSIRLVSIYCKTANKDGIRVYLIKYWLLPCSTESACSHASNQMQELWLPGSWMLPTSLTSSCGPCSSCADTALAWASGPPETLVKETGGHPGQRLRDLSIVSSQLCLALALGHHSSWGCHAIVSSLPPHIPTP